MYIYIYINIPKLSQSQVRDFSAFHRPIVLAIVDLARRFSCFLPSGNSVPIYMGYLYHLYHLYQVHMYPLVIEHSHGIDGPFIDGLPIKNGNFPSTNGGFSIIFYCHANQRFSEDLILFSEVKLLKKTWNHLKHFWCLRFWARFQI